MAPRGIQGQVREIRATNARDHKLACTLVWEERNIEDAPRTRLLQRTQKIQCEEPTPSIKKVPTVITR